MLRFELLKEEVEVDSIDEFREKIIGDFPIKLVTTKKNYDAITNKEKLNVLLKFLDELFAEFKQYIQQYRGTEFEADDLKTIFANEVRKNVKEDDDSQDLAKKLKDKDWYVLDQFYGTSEERELIQFIQDSIINLTRKYEAVYLLRNEKQYKIYDFKTGRGFQPDFILFLQTKTKAKTKAKTDAKTDDNTLYYQILIEPKGDHLLDKDKWKNDFLKEITKKYSDNKILQIESKNYKLIGLPFFNKNKNTEFTDKYKKLIPYKNNNSSQEHQQKSKKK